MQVNLLTLFCVLYVDNGAFPFEERLQLKLGLSLIHNHFVKFGLEMHIGRGKKASKTKCILFPPPGFFQQKKILSCEINGENMVSIRRSQQVKGESMKKMQTRREFIYRTYRNKIDSRGERKSNFWSSLQMLRLLDLLLTTRRS